MLQAGADSLPMALPAAILAMPELARCCLTMMALNYAVCLGICTNNVAEDRALLAGLEEAKRCGCSHIALFLDSELVVRQLQGRYKVKHEQLQPLHQKASALLAGLSGWSIAHVPRSDNAIADSLANKGIDSHLAHEKADEHKKILDGAMRPKKQAALLSD